MSLCCVGIYLYPLQELKRHHFSRQHSSSGSFSVGFVDSMLAAVEGVAAVPTTDVDFFASPTFFSFGKGGPEEL